MTLPTSYPIANLIQGVSQQAPMQRRDTQCEEQFDCINDVVNGATARPGADLVKFIASLDLRGYFFYEINRGIQEHYLVAIGETGAGAPELRAFNLMDGTEAAITAPGGFGYLAVTGTPKDAFAAATVEDFTFIANKETIPAMDSGNTSPAPVNEALVHFRAGGYLNTYQVSVLYSGTNYRFTYKTPDNSAAANAEKITTNFLAATFYRAFTGNDATTATLIGVGASHAGDTTYTQSNGTLTAQGFTIDINGNALRIRRNDATAFVVDVADGLGNSHIKVAKDTVQDFADLPQIAFDAFTIKVKGESRTSEDDYYVKFVSNGAGGHWEETVKPGTVVGLDPAKMPHELINTGANAFTFQQAPWGERVVGDEVSAPDPSFIGKPLQDIFHDRDRLAILAEGSCVWSKSRNVYVYFRDTAQTILATDHIDLQIAGTRKIALLRRAAHHSRTTMLWAQKAQFVISSGQETFKANAVEAIPSTNYEFAEKADLLGVGTSFYFTTETGLFATIRDLLINNGVPVDDTDITAHVSQYIPSGVRFLAASDTTNTAFVFSDSTPSRLYVYNWFFGAGREGDGQGRLQSAWNTWLLPAQSEILWVGVFRAALFLVVHRADGMAILKADLSRSRVDAEGGYLTRLDFRVTDADCVVTYIPATDTTTIKLPYIPQELNPADERPAILVVTRTAAGPLGRGYVMEIESVLGATLTVKGDAVSNPFYAGFRIASKRKESQLWLRSNRGAIPVDKLQVHDYVVVHAKTGYYRAEVEYLDSQSKQYEWEGRTFGSPANVIGQVVLEDGTFTVPINADNTFYGVTLVNDSFLPSFWQTADFRYEAAVRARQAGAGNP